VPSNASSLPPREPYLREKNRLYIPLFDGGPEWIRTTDLTVISRAL
jgi:hypothetical protein